jgi:hypothetical protein
MDEDMLLIEQSKLKDEECLEKWRVVETWKPPLSVKMHGTGAGRPSPTSQMHKQCELCSKIHWDLFLIKKNMTRN